MFKILPTAALAAVFVCAPILTAHAASHETPPAGDIPDSQVFVTFASPLGFSIKVPEGWARRESPGMVRFEDKFLSLQVALAPRAAAPTVGEVSQHELPALGRSTRGFRLVKVEPVKLPAGPVVEARYSADSAPNPVTNKSVRLDCIGHYAWKGGKMATVTFCAPAGADNADQWALMSRSFKWQ